MVLEKPTPAHMSDPTSFKPDKHGFYVPRCTCGWTFGPVPDIDVVCDALMDHAAYAEAQRLSDRLRGGR